MNLKSRSISFPKNLGLILLCVWLIALGTTHLLGVGGEFLSMALDILAIVAGVLLLLQTR